MPNIFRENDLEVGSSYREFLQSGNLSKLKWKLYELKTTEAPH
jgi:hypothetical protein